MTATLSPSILSIRTFLLGGDEDDTETLRRSLADNGVLSTCGGLLARLTDAAGEAVHEQLASVAAELVDIDLGDVLMAGWQLHRRLKEAAAATLMSPGSKEVIELGPHEIPATYEPTIDLIVNEKCLHTFHVKLDVVLEIATAVVVVEHGRLTQLRCGDTAATCTLTLDHAVLAHKRGHLQLPPIYDSVTGLPLQSRAGRGAD